MATLTSPLRARAAALCLAGILPGCGDPLVDRLFQGDPLISVRGNVSGASDVLPLEKPLVRISAWWSPVGLQVSDYSQLVEQPSITTQSTVPFSFTLNVFDTPTLFTQLPDGTRYAVGSLLGYYDQNENGHRDPGEPLLGNTRRVLLYAPQPLAISQSPLGRALKPGYYLTSNSFACPPSAGGPPPMPPPQPPGADCSQNLSQACTQNADCAPGICVRDFVSPWPQGGCVLPDPLPAGCSSRGAARVTSPSMSDPRRDMTYWVKACTSNEDCGRSFPYQCDASLAACLPTQIVTVSLSDSLPVPRWCRQP